MERERKAKEDQERLEAEVAAEQAKLKKMEEDQARREEARREQERLQAEAAQEPANDEKEEIQLDGELDENLGAAGPGAAAAKPPPEEMKVEDDYQAPESLPYLDYAAEEERKKAALKDEELAK